MAKPNYELAKRQRSLAKKQKKQEKLRRKSTTNDIPATESSPGLPADEKTTAP